MTARLSTRAPLAGVGSVEKAFTVCIILCAVAFAALKAWRAPITTDEAWSYNEWISHGLLRVWTDYSAANNHILHNLLGVFCVRFLGNAPLVLRLPSLLGFALLLIASAAWMRRTCTSGWVRVACVAFLGFHPYLVDFASLARGYSLAAGLCVVALFLLDDGLRRAGAGTLSSSWHAGLMVGLGSLCLGLAAGCVPLTVHLGLAAAIVLGSAHATVVRRHWRLAIPAAVVPGALVAIVCYARVMNQFRRGLFYFGALSVKESLLSLHRVLVYIPQAAVDRLGHPSWTASGFVSWQGGWPPDAMYALLYGTPGRCLLGLLVAASVAVALHAFRDRASRGQGIMGAVFLMAVESSFLAFCVSRTRLPMNRTWLLMIPVAIIAVFTAADRLLATRAAGGGRLRVCVAGVIFGILFLNGISRLDVHGFWEWPDNAVVPAVLARLEAERDPQHPTRIGYPPYLNACLVYERDRRSLDWLKVAPGGMSEEPAWDYMLVNRWNMEARRYGHYRVVEEFAALDVVLMRHEDGH